jgi:hypothetical protein
MEGLESRARARTSKFAALAAARMMQRITRKTQAIMRLERWTAGAMLTKTAQLQRHLMIIGEAYTPTSQASLSPMLPPACLTPSHLTFQNRTVSQAPACSQAGS